MHYGRIYASKNTVIVSFILKHTRFCVNFVDDDTKAVLKIRFVVYQASSLLDYRLYLELLHDVYFNSNEMCGTMVKTPRMKRPTVVVAVPFVFEGMWKEQLKAEFSNGKHNFRALLPLTPRSLLPPLPLHVITTTNAQRLNKTPRTPKTTSPTALTR